MERAGARSHQDLTKVRLVLIIPSVDRQPPTGIIFILLGMGVGCSSRFGGNQMPVRIWITGLTGKGLDVDHIDDLVRSAFHNSTSGIFGG